MSQNIKPYVATASAPDSNTLLAKLAQVKAVLEKEQEDWWAELETPFEINLTHNRLEIPKKGQLRRGRLFWEEAEIRFRYDGSRLTDPYQLVLVADQPLFSGDFQHYQDVSPLAEWEAQDFQRVLWGAHLKDENTESWYTLRIPVRFNYEGITVTEGSVPVVGGKEYRRLGRVEYFRFTKLDLAKLK